MITQDEIINNIDLPDFKEKNDFFGFEASKRKVYTIQENKRISDLDSKIKYAANRVFINNGDSYHGKYIIQEISQVLFNSIEYSYQDNESIIENIIPFNKEFEVWELNNINKELQLNKNMTTNQTQKVQTSITNIIPAAINPSIKKNEPTSEVNSKNHNYSSDTETNLQPIINTETINMYNILKPTMKVNEQQTEMLKYNIVTTVKNKLKMNNEKYEYLKQTKKIIIPHDKKLLMKEIQKCAVVVYDISLDKNQIPEAYAALQEIIEDINFIKNHPKSDIAKQSGIKVFILISSIQTWALTTKTKNDVPITQDDYKRRICHPNFQEYYDIENKILLLNDKYFKYFYGIVIASGLVYGHGENMLKYIYKTVFNDTEQLLIPKYNNNLPIIHVENLAKIVKNVMIHYDKLTKPYIIGVETSRFSLRNITDAIKDEVDKTNFKYCDFSSLFLNSMVTQTVYDMVTMSIQIVPTIDDYITHFMSLDISIPKMFTETSELISEYLDDFKMKYVIINGPHEIMYLAKKLAHEYNLDLIDPITASEEFLNFLVKYTFKETNIDNVDSGCLKSFSKWLENATHNKLIDPTNQINTPISNRSTNITTSFQTFSAQDTDYYRNKLDNQPIYSNRKLLMEQIKHFEDNGRISDTYLLPFIKNKITHNKGNKCGYIFCNFPETIEQAQNIFNFEKLISKKENTTYSVNDKIQPTIIIDVIRVGKNMMNKVLQYKSATEQLQLDFNSKLLLDNEIDKSQDWFSLDSKYTDSELMMHILENENIEIRKNRKLVDYYIEILDKPKFYKEYLLITEKNLISISNEEFDKLFDSLLTRMPLEIKVTEAEDEVSSEKDMISKVYDIHQSIIKSVILKKEEDNNRQNVDQLLNDKTVIEERLFLSGNIKIINFLVKCVNPIIVNGILEIIKNMPDDPIDFLAEYIYKHNKYNPCVSSQLKRSKVTNNLKKHLL